MTGWTKKHGRSYYGYKNHICIDRRHKFIRRYAVTDVARHDSQEFVAPLDRAVTSRDMWGDTAYRSSDGGKLVRGIGSSGRG